MSLAEDIALIAETRDPTAKSQANKENIKPPSRVHPLDQKVIGRANEAMERPRRGQASQMLT